MSSCILLRAYFWTVVAFVFSVPGFLCSPPCCPKTSDKLFRQIFIATVRVEKLVVCFDGKVFPYLVIWHYEGDSDREKKPEKEYPKMSDPASIVARDEIWTKWRQASFLKPLNYRVLPTPHPSITLSPLLLLLSISLMHPTSSSSTHPQ